MATSKEIGNGFERKIAKQLSMWMFNEPNIIRRHPDSGATKGNYCGDIFPMAQIKWKYWPFIVELKKGYEQFTPTFWNFNKISDWFTKAYNEGLIHNQNIVLLITKFTNKSPLIITNTVLKHEIWKLCFPVVINNKYIYVYVYSYNDMLKNDFENVFNLEEFI